MSVPGFTSKKSADADSLYPQQTFQFAREGAVVYLGDSLQLYKQWPSPTVIISDGPYGLGSYKGDPLTPQ
ncbi:hypothetical protein VT99_12453, partial [Candidatus Electrothrix marina]